MNILDIINPPPLWPQRVGIGQVWVNGLYYVKFDFRHNGHLIFALWATRMEKFRLLGWFFERVFQTGRTTMRREI